MAHYRQTIRNAVVDILDGLETTEDRVFATRTAPLASDKLPALCIYTVSETSEPHRIGSSRAVLRKLSLVVEGVAEVNETLDDTLDDIAAEVETAIGADTTLGLSSGVYDCTLDSTQIAIRGGAESKKETGSVVMTFTVNYRTLLANPATAAV